MSLHKPQGWKRGKKVTAYSPEFTVIKTSNSFFFFFFAIQLIHYRPVMYVVPRKIVLNRIKVRFNELLFWLLTPKHCRIATVLWAVSLHHQMACETNFRPPIGYQKKRRRNLFSRPMGCMKLVSCDIRWCHKFQYKQALILFVIIWNRGHSCIGTKVNQTENAIFLCHAVTAELKKGKLIY